MRAVLFTLMWLASTAAMPATVYKWVDENGVVHYSDQPHPQAEKLDVQPAPTYSPAPAASQPSGQRAAAQGPVGAYEMCEIARPTNDQVIFNTTTVTASVRAEPELRQGHEIVLVLDGRRLTGLPSSGNEITISPVFRGTHALMAQIADRDGRTLCQTESVTFHVRQPSLQAPNPANRPKF